MAGGEAGSAATWQSHRGVQRATGPELMGQCGLLVQSQGAAEGKTSLQDEQGLSARRTL